MPDRSIAILGGTGQQGGGIARRLIASGQQIIIGSRSPSNAIRAIEGWNVPAGSVTVVDYPSAASADTVILAVPFPAVADALAVCRDRFKPESLVVDVTVPVTFEASAPRLLRPSEGSGAEFVRARLPSDIHLAATFKTLPAALLNDVEQPLDCDEFVCGDSAEARMLASALLTSVAGVRPIDVGPLSSAAAIEQMTLLAITINRRHRVHRARFRIVGI